jgi:hypothetical protein
VPSPPQDSRQSRRDLLKKAAIGGGVAAAVWVAPTVSAVAGAGPAPQTDETPSTITTTTAGCGDATGEHCLQVNGGNWFDWRGTSGDCLVEYNEIGGCVAGNETGSSYLIFYQTEDPNLACTEFTLDGFDPDCSFWKCQSCNDD